MCPVWMCAPCHLNVHLVVVAGLRHVVPYVHKFGAFAKQRWFGRTLLDIYSNEFTGFDDEYWVSRCPHHPSVRDDIVAVLHSGVPCILQYAQCHQHEQCYGSVQQALADVLSGYCHDNNHCARKGLVLPQTRTASPV